MADLTDKTDDIAIWNEGRTKAVTLTTGQDGKEHLDANIIQNVVLSTGNSSVANLASGASFTGTSISTLGAGAVQVNIIADQDVTVAVQQSTDGTNWDIEDRWTIDATQGDGRTFQLTSSYVRVKVTNNGASTTTYLRLQTVLAPIIDALPRALSQGGGLKVSVNESSGAAHAAHGDMFSVNILLSVGSSEGDFALFRNPSGSLKDVYIYKLILDVVTKARQCIWKIYAAPTITTVGTTVTPLSRLFKGTPPSSGMNVYSAPTISARGTRVAVFSSGQDSNSLINMLDFSLIVGPGKDILLTTQATNSNTDVASTMIWSEE